jgi:mRNA interferase MazF
VPQPGDIVPAHFPFTSQGGTKLRPVLVLAEIPGPYPDFIVVFISSQLSQAVPGFDLVLGPTDPAFPRSGLKVASVFRIGKVASISGALLGGTLGHLDAAILKEIVRRLTHLFRPGQPPARRARRPGFTRMRRRPRRR